MAGNHQDLASLVQRLEQVAARLEKLHSGQQSDKVTALLTELAAFKAGGPSSDLGRLMSAVASLEKNVDGAGGDHSPSLQDFDSILNGSLNTFVGLSSKLGNEVRSLGEMVDVAFKAQKAFLIVASKAKKPSDADLARLLKPTSDKINEIQSFRESQRRSPYFNHLSAISESIPALGWVTVAPTPAPFVKEMTDAGQFYTNRVLKDWKEKDKTHVDWTKAWLSCLTELHAFIKQHHTTGLQWNAKGCDAVSLTITDRTAAASSSTAAGGPPAPPPPPPPGLFDDIKNKGNSDMKARNELFADINRGEDVTKGLKKVTADMQTHKNPSLRDSAPVKTEAKHSKVTTAQAGLKTAVQQQKPPRFELDGKKWTVEYQIKNLNLVIQNTDRNQSVYIYRCEGSTVKVEGKVNNIIMDSCKKCAVVFENVISSCEFINCQSVQMQVLGSVPTISVEKTDGCQMYLSNDSLSTEIVTAKSSEMNVLIPDANGEFVEQPVPEQFKTVIRSNKLVTSVSESV